MSPTDKIVQEMALLGAVFTVAATGDDGLPRWHWSPYPETMRVPIRSLWRSVKLRPSDSEMVAAIQRLGLDRGTA